MLFQDQSFLLRCSVLLAAAAAASCTCMTGPSVQHTTSTLLVGIQYIEASSSVECSGVIVRWYFCHFVIGYRLQEKQLWAGVWRADGDLFRLVGLNKLLIDPPGFSDIPLLCLNYTVPSEQWIETQDGDLVGFFTPDSNGVFIATASERSDPDQYQKRRKPFGYAEVLNASELFVESSQNGRALVKAEIDTTAVKPSPNVLPSTTTTPLPTTTLPSTTAMGTTTTITATPPPPPTTTVGGGGQNEPTVTTVATETGGGDSSSVGVVSVAVVAVIVIIGLLIVIAVLLIVLRRKMSALHRSTHPDTAVANATNLVGIQQENGNVTYDSIFNSTADRTRPTGVTGDNDSVAYEIISHRYPTGAGTASNLSAANGMRITGNPAYVDTLQKSLPPFPASRSPAGYHSHDSAPHAYQIPLPSSPRSPATTSRLLPSPPFPSSSSSSSSSLPTRQRTNPYKTPRPSVPLQPDVPRDD